MISGLTKILQRINELRPIHTEFERDYYESLLIVLDTLEKCLSSQAVQVKYDEAMNVKLLLRKICQFLARVSCQKFLDAPPCCKNICTLIRKLRCSYQQCKGRCRGCASDRKRKRVQRVIKRISWCRKEFLSVESSIRKKDETAKTALIFQRKFLILKHRDVSLCNLCTFYPGKAHELQIVEYMQTEPMNHAKHGFVFQPRFG